MKQRHIEVLGLIPARGGSKGIPRKNMRPLAGRPLITYTFDAAKASQKLTRIILSTDDDEIAELGRKSGIEVPFIRPEELANDTSPMLSVVQHTLTWMMEGENYQPEIIVLLQPTTPLRQGHHIDDAIEKLIKANGDSIVSVTEVPRKFSPLWQVQIEDDALRIFTGDHLSQIVTRRQDLPITYTRNGAIYAFTYSSFLTTGSLFGRRCIPYEMESEISINIDDLDDWKRIEAYLSEV